MRKGIAIWSAVACYCIFAAQGFAVDKTAKPEDENKMLRQKNARLEKVINQLTGTLNKGPQKNTWLQGGLKPSGTADTSDVRKDSTFYSGGSWDPKSGTAVSTDPGEENVLKGITYTIWNEVKEGLLAKIDSAIHAIYADTANYSHTLEGLQASQFLRSDEDDETSGKLTVNDTLFVSTIAGISPAKSKSVLMSGTKSPNAISRASVEKTGKSPGVASIDLVGDTVAITGNVGVGTSSPGEKLTVDGIIYSMDGGFKFPDLTIQTTAAEAVDVDAIKTLIYTASGF